MSFHKGVSSACAAALLACGSPAVAQTGMQASQPLLFGEPVQSPNQIPLQQLRRSQANALATPASTSDEITLVDATGKTLAKEFAGAAAAIVNGRTTLIVGAGPIRYCTQEGPRPGGHDACIYRAAGLEWRNPGATVFYESADCSGVARLEALPQAAGFQQFGVPVFDDASRALFILVADTSPSIVTLRSLRYSIYTGCYSADISPTSTVTVKAAYPASEFGTSPFYWK